MKYSFLLVLLCLYVLIITLTKEIQCKSIQFCGCFDDDTQFVQQQLVDPAHIQLLLHIAIKAIHDSQHVHIWVLLTSLGSYSSSALLFFLLSHFSTISALKLSDTNSPNIWGKEKDIPLLFHLPNLSGPIQAAYWGCGGGHFWPHPCRVGPSAT